jgi:preflagellin peptidase FlaK
VEIPSGFRLAIRNLRNFTGGFPYLKSLLLSGIIVYVSVNILFQFGAFGGGDAKGLIVLSILFPMGMFCYNLLHFSPEMLKKPLYMFIGYRTEVSSLKNKEHLALLNYRRFYLIFQYKKISYYKDFL